jgi:hypothetical protein
MPREDSRCKKLMFAVMICKVHTLVEVLLLFVVMSSVHSLNLIINPKSKSHVFSPTHDGWC